MSFRSLFNKVSSKFSTITSAIPDIAQQIENNLNKTVNTFKAEALDQLGLGDIGGGISGPAGSNLFAAMNPKQFKSNLSAKPGPIGFTTKAGFLVPGESQPPWPNELENFASMSCHITLAALSHKEISDPKNTYRKSGLKNIVLQSGGGAGTKKNKTQIEKALGGSVEFFIDNLKVDTIPESKLGYTKNSNVTEVSFDVLEPYSLGLFYQALEIAAREAGFLDYNTACFVLQLDFKGWSVDGTEVDVPYARRLLPIRLTESTFSTNEGGSTYKVTGVAWNARALNESVQQIKTDVSLRGRDVREILQNGAMSLTAVMNKRLEEMQEQDQVDVADKYVILFPKDNDVDLEPVELRDTATTSPHANEFSGYGPDNIADGATVNGQGLDLLWASMSGEETTVPKDFDTYLNTISGNVKSNNNLEYSLKKYAASDFSLNEIGASKMLDSPYEGGIQPMANPKFAGPPSAQEDFRQEQNRVDEFNEQVEKNIAFSEKFPILHRANKNMQLNGEIRTYNFSAGTRIQEIIEEILITSMYGRKLQEQLRDLKDPMGFVKWFTIQTAEYTIPENSELGRTGQMPTIHVYRVVPYMVHMSPFKAPTAPAKGIAELKKEVAKEYNYIYTGKNKDVLEFNIEYNNSFIHGGRADRFSSSADQTKGAAGTQIAETPDPILKTADGSAGTTNEAPAKTAEIVNSGSGNAGGTGYSNTAINVARMFNDRFLHSSIDMLDIQMTIMGDPFYISDNGVGNYFAQDTSYVNMTQDGHANYSNGELHINIVFRTPVDLNPENGTYIFPEDLIIVNQFSGVYKINQVTNNISGNQFTQTLFLNRLVGQDNQSQTQNIGAYVETSDLTSSMNEKASVFAKKVSDAVITTGATENLETYKKEVALLLGGYQGLNDIVSKQAQSLGLPALDAFGNIGASLKLIQSQIGIADLGKIGSEFNNLKSAATSFASNTLSQVNLSGGDVLGKFGTTVTNTVGNNANLQKLASNASTVAMQVPTNIEAVATANAEAIKKLNTNFADRGPR